MKNKVLSLFVVMTMLFTQLSVVMVNAYASMPDDEGSMILRPIDATYVSQHGTDNDTNYYGESVMKINNTSHNSGSTDYGQYGYMKFDMSGIEKERIKNAKLRVYVENEGDKRASKRTIGIYDTCDKNWDGTQLTWSNNPYPYAKTLLGTFEVNANGSTITDAGWREIDITEYARDNIESILSFMVKMQTKPAHNVVLSSGTYMGEPSDFDSTVYNANMPQIVIDYCAASATPYSTTMLNPTRDTYVDQHTPNTNYLNDEYMQVNFTDNENRSDRYGRYAYMDFDLSDIDKETLSTAKLWVYVDPNSDTRNSTRTIGIFAPATTWSDSMTWSSGRVAADGDVIGTYTVTGNDFDIIDYGWKCIDITDYVKSVSADTLSLIMQSINSNAHPVLVRSNEYSDENTRPRIVITHENIEAHFEDDNFLNEVRASIGKTSDEQIYIEDLVNITMLDVSNKDINSLAGIEYLTGLKELRCCFNNLSELDLSQNTELEILDCSYNLQLSALNVSRNVKLKELYCNYAQLTKLDVTNNIQLISLVCFANQLGTLDISKNIVLQTLDVRDAGLTMLDVSDNPALTYLNCTHNYMDSTEDVVEWEKCDLILDDTFKFTPQRTEDITDVFTDENFLQAIRDEIKKPVGSIYPSDLREVTELNVSHKGISNLDGIEQFRSLQELNCGWNYLTELDVTSNTELIKVDCSKNELNELNIEKNTDIQILDVSQNKLKDIDTVNNVSLIELNVSENLLTELDISTATSLINVKCSENLLLDVSDITFPATVLLQSTSSSLENSDINWESDNVFWYNNTLFEYGPQSIGRVLEMQMSVIASGNIYASGYTSPKSYVYVYDITDHDFGCDFIDGDVPDSDILEEILNSDITPIGIISTGSKTISFNKEISNIALRNEYTLVSIVINEIDYDLEKYGKINIVDNQYYPKVKNFSVDNGNGTVTELVNYNENNSDSVQIIKFYGKKVTFTIDLENYNNIEAVYVEMSRDDHNTKVDKYIEAISMGDGRFEATDTVKSGGEVYAYESRTGTINILCVMNNGSDNVNKIYTTRAILVVDPSGYIYEAVPSNRLQNVTTTLYYMNQDGVAVEWNAEEYGQINPNITGTTGNFEWFVPSGLWQVKAELEGYETYYSEWLPVPPQQLDVNFSMVSSVTPSVKNVLYDNSGIEIEFDKYMYAEDMTADNITVIVNGSVINGNIELIDSEVDYWEGTYDTNASGGTGNEYVSKVRFVPNVEFENGNNVEITINGDVRSYADESMSVDYIKEFLIL